METPVIYVVGILPSSKYFMRGVTTETLVAPPPGAGPRPSCCVALRLEAEKKWPASIPRDLHGHVQTVEWNAFCEDMDDVATKKWRNGIRKLKGERMLAFLVFCCLFAFYLWVLRLAEVGDKSDFQLAFLRLLAFCSAFGFAGLLFMSWASFLIPADWRIFHDVSSEMKKDCVRKLEMWNHNYRDRLMFALDTFDAIGCVDNGLTIDMDNAIFVRITTLSERGGVPSHIIRDENDLQIGREQIIHLYYNHTSEIDHAVLCQPLAANEDQCEDGFEARGDTSTHSFISPEVTEEVLGDHDTGNIPLSCSSKACINRCASTVQDSSWLYW